MSPPPPLSITWRATQGEESPSPFFQPIIEPYYLLLFYHSLHYGDHFRGGEMSGMNSYPRPRSDPLHCEETLEPLLLHLV
jgi:hypothetical protein